MTAGTKDCLRGRHGNLMPTLPSLWAPEVVMTTTPGAASEDQVRHMIDIGNSPRSSDAYMRQLT